jgi:hypothetical protein
MSSERVARASPPMQLGLSPLDRRVALAFVDGDPETLADLLELVRQCAQSLVGSDRIGARQRLVAREIALEKAAMDLLVAAIGEHVRRGINNERSVRVAAGLDRLATGACRRLTMLLGVATEPRSAAVSIQNAIVNVEAAE